MGLFDRISGADHLRNANRARMAAANVELRDPDYYQTTSRAMGQMDERAGNQQAILDKQYWQTMGQAGGAHKAALERLSNIYGGAQSKIDQTFTQGRDDIKTGTLQNQMALRSMAGGSLGQMGASSGGSLAAKFGALSQMQNQFGSQMLQNQAQGNQAMGALAGQHMGVTGELAGSQGYSTSQLDINQANILARLGQAFAQMGQENQLQHTQMGIGLGQADFENLFNQALTRRGVEQEPFLAEATNQMGLAQHQQGLFSMGANMLMGLATAPLGGTMLGGALSGLGGLGSSALSGLGNAFGGLGGLFGQSTPRNLQENPMGSMSQDYMNLPD
jgi:hypothetical protein